MPTGASVSTACAIASRSALCVATACSLASTSRATQTVLFVSLDFVARRTRPLLLTVALIAQDWYRKSMQFRPISAALLVALLCAACEEQAAPDLEGEGDGAAPIQDAA